MAPNTLDELSNATRTRWDARYREGVTPWDTQVTPPEVVDFWQANKLARQGVALDLGCGPGTNVLYLAALGLTAIGVEIAGAPLITARSRARQVAPNILQRAHFLCSDVCQLPFQQLDASYILDVGCFHSLPRVLRPYYVSSVIANLAKGGFYHLYAFDADPENPEPDHGPGGMLPDEVASSFSPSLEVVVELIARPDRRPCRWYLLQKPA